MKTKIVIHKTLAIFCALILLALAHSSYAKDHSFATIQASSPIDLGPGKWPDPRMVPFITDSGEVCSKLQYDNLTGLVWYPAVLKEEPVTYSHGKHSTESLSVCGIKMRLPTVYEAVGLIDYKSNQPIRNLESMFKMAPFPNDAAIWVASYVGNNMVLKVSLFDGAVSSYSPVQGGHTARILPVAGPLKNGTAKKG